MDRSTEKNTLKNHIKSKASKIRKGHFQGSHQMKREYDGQADCWGAGGVNKNNQPDQSAPFFRP